MNAHIEWATCVGIRNVYEITCSSGILFAARLEFGFLTMKAQNSTLFLRFYFIRTQPYKLNLSTLSASYFLHVL